MRRRDFVQSLGAGLGLSLLACGKGRDGFAIHVQDQALRAHRLFQDPPRFEAVRPITCDVLVVGGGVAGVSAAVAARNEHVVLCEVGEQLGGSSVAGSHGATRFAQGAHYELAYPTWFGPQTLSFLERYGLIGFNGAQESWQFLDERYTVDPKQEGRTFAGGTYRDDVLPPGPERRQFEAITEVFAGKLPMPIHNLDPRLHDLNDGTFYDYLAASGLPLSPAFVEALDYHMRDDYGADSRTVSALAGLHYYRCRPYYQRDVQLFSPPEGNAYFVTHLAKTLPPQTLQLRNLVCRIQPISPRYPKRTGFWVDVWDWGRQEPVRYRARHVVYAAHKHALAHIFPTVAAPFEGLRSAPWLIVNVVFRGQIQAPAYWQNDMLAGDSRYLGFINSRAQTQQGPPVLSAYFCLPEGQRRQLLDLARDGRKWANTAIAYMELTLGQPLLDAVDSVYLRPHGHGMPIPVPGYLFADANRNRPYHRLVFAGVDNGRLPLFFEAVDSGLSAVKQIL